MAEGDRRLFAVIPAAGHSRRMGRPKLLLRLSGQTVISRLVGALRDANVAEIFVLVRENDAPLREELSQLPCTAVVAPNDPPQMRDSIEHLLGAIRRDMKPGESDGWLLIPADHPVVEGLVLARLVETWKAHPNRIVIPTHENRRGHPTLFPWTAADQVPTIPPDHGLNWLVRREPSRVIEVPGPEPSVLFDLDTPEDLEKAVRWLGKIE